MRQTFLLCADLSDFGKIPCQYVFQRIFLAYAIQSGDSIIKISKRTSDVGQQYPVLMHLHLVWCSHKQTA